METFIHSLTELDTFVVDFLSQLNQKKTATIVALSGDLGVGKTAFVKSAAQYLGITVDITSPTFVIQKEYEIAGHVLFKKMVHIDAYRLENASELEYLKWSHTIANPQTIIFIEWPEQVIGIDLPEAHFVNLEIVGKDTRKISY